MSKRNGLAWFGFALLAGLFVFGMDRGYWPGLELGRAQGQGSSVSKSSGIRVKTTRPRTGGDLAVVVEQPAEVAPYYRVELQSQVAGTLKYLEKDIGDKVVAGERLAEIEPTGANPDRKGNALVTAPFDGVISRRSADPGTFVANPALVPGVVPLLVVERTDIVTVSMKVPEAFVAHVRRDTEGELQMDALPGKVLRFKLTRIAPSLDRADRTLRVEVDLFNGTQAEHKQFLDRVRVNQKADLKGKALPEFPQGLEAGQSARLLPGMYGKMKLKLKRFQDVPLIPSSAIVYRGGLAYLFHVESGVAKLRRIAVELDDGSQTHVFWLEKGPAGQVRRELTVKEELVLTNQGELDEGSQVQPVLVE